jgi:hypothetical protein
MSRNGIQIQIRNQLESRIGTDPDTDPKNIIRESTTLHSGAQLPNKVLFYICRNNLYVRCVGCRGTLKCTVLANFKLCRTLKFRGGDTITKAGLKRGD